MRELFIALLFCIISQLTFSQTDSTLPIYRRFPTIPQFTINKASDSTAFTRDNLERKKSTVFMIFNPECEHCQRETDSLIAHINLFKKAQIIMVSYLTHDDMVKFYKDYSIADYPNIIMGRDAKYFLPVFFKIENLPAIYVYDKKGNFKSAFQGSVNVEAIAGAL